ncbi:MAG: FAD-dependent oxidoreductase, partial [Planctomycetes bacterium]|nr:FAD-dependent oxidoreductase [Planctomycetota bacterium]
ITQAERLAIELILDAAAAEPRCRAWNHVRIDGIEDGTVRLTDAITGAQASVVPRVVVNATGAWVDRANAALGIDTRFMAGTKGSHLVIDLPALRDALGERMVYYEHADGRVCIAFAFMGKVIMGSTDIRVDDPDRARCDADEIDYMLATLRDVFPSLEIPRERIVHTFCGVRPLPATGDKIVGTITRGHTIHTIEPDGARPFPIICLIGGKWTTFRALAEQTADRILPVLGAARRTTTEAVPIGGGRDYPADAEAKERWIERVASETGLSRERTATLLARFGTGAEAYARGLGGRAETPLETLPDYAREEIAHMGATEYVGHIDDLVCRRSVIALLGDARREVLEEIAGILAGPRGWDAARCEEEVARAEGEIRG